MSAPVVVVVAGARVPVPVVLAAGARVPFLYERFVSWTGGALSAPVVVVAGACVPVPGGARCAVRLAPPDCISLARAFARHDPAPACTPVCRRRV